MSRWISGLAASLHLKTPLLPDHVPHWVDEDAPHETIHYSRFIAPPLAPDAIGLAGTWFINEESETQRRFATEYWYDKANMKATRFPAVEIEAADIEPHGWCHSMYKMMAYVNPSLSANGTKTLGIIGCVTSHLAVLGEIRATGKPGEVFLIAEDDHRIDPSFLERLPEVLSYVPANWDSIRFDCWSNKEEPLEKCEKVKKGLYRTAIRDCDASNRTHLQDPNCSFCGGTHAMLVRFEAVDRLVGLWSGAKGPLLPADCMLTRDDYNNYCLQWNLFHVEPSLETTSKLYTSRLARTV
jgi:GR25 family glycosyltransferase involved in LPS biosynthesis